MDLEEVIVQFIGNEDIFLEREIENEVLLGNFAIIRATQEQIEELEIEERIIYIERPEAMYYEAIDDELFTMEVSFFQEVCPPGDNLTGQGILMAYLDSGIDYRHPEFINSDGNTRIQSIYDLSQPVPRLYTEDEINQAIHSEGDSRDTNLPSSDLSGHGTHVAGIGSGNSGVAPESRIIMVKLGRGEKDATRSSMLMRGIDYCIRTARQIQWPIVINISYGNNYGAHNGSSIVELYLNEVMNYGKATIVAGSGNEGSARGHFKGKTQAGVPQRVQLAVGKYQQRFFVQLWKRYEDDIRLEVIASSGEVRQVQISEGGTSYPFNQEILFVRSIGPTPRQEYQEIILELVPRNEYVGEGLWQFWIYSTSSKSIEFDMWIPVSENLAELTGFLEPNPETTLTIPSTAVRVITVGAYDARYGQVASFSGRGYEWKNCIIKPELVAPGVNIISASVGGGYTAKSGTSMAAPFVSGAAALLMEWGIRQGNDPFLYSEKVKAYLIKGALPLSSEVQYPNPRTGYGRLCIANSIPGINKV